MMTASPVYAALGLSRNPFPPTPDAGSYFFTPRLEEDFAEIAHCIEARKGFVLLTGEVGLGKSTMVRRLLDMLEEKKCHSALILNTFLQDGALLSAIQTDFGLPPSGSVEQGLARLTKLLIARHQAGDISLLVIDDAQNLSVQSLELVRLLCNLETGQEKLLQILLVGQPELEQTLARPELRQLKSRIVKHACLRGLQRDELARYFDFRTNAANAEGRLSIGSAAVDALHRVTAGNLRRIHLVLDRCMYGLASMRTRVVTESLVQCAVAELPALSDETAAVPVRPRHSRAWIVAGLVMGTTATVAIAGLGLISSTEPTVDLAATMENAADASAAMPSLPQAPVAAVPASAASVAGSDTAPEGGSIALVAAAPSPAEPVSARRACEQRLQGAATADDVLQVQRLPGGVAINALKPSPRVCRFADGGRAWVAWLSRDDASHIQVAQQATRSVQAKLENMGLLDAEESGDGLLGPKTSKALARFQHQHGLSATGNPDELTLFLLEHQDVSAR